VTSPSYDPAVTAALTRCADELRAMRQSLDALVTENTTLRARLEQSEAARNDLVAQVEHVIELLAESRAALRAQPGKGPAPKT